MLPVHELFCEKCLMVLNELEDGLTEEIALRTVQESKTELSESVHLHTPICQLNMTTAGTTVRLGPEVG